MNLQHLIFRSCSHVVPDRARPFKRKCTSPTHTDRNVSKVRSIDKVDDHPEQMDDCGEALTTVDFCVTWCEKCNELMPKLEAVFADQQSQYRRINMVDDCPKDVLVNCQVNSVPALIEIKQD
jgi:thioredoxin-like negative regulator of GroEL